MKRTSPVVVSPTRKRNGAVGGHLERWRRHLERWRRHLGRRRRKATTAAAAAGAVPFS